MGHHPTVKSKRGMGMKNSALVMLLTLLCSVAAAHAKVEPSTAERHSEERLGQLEEIAMCHHAIKAAYHDAIAFSQNPYYRYIVYAPQKEHGSNVYPIPERCKSLATSLILNYTNMSAATKMLEDKTIHDTVGMTISDMATDAQFLTVAINKIDLEGYKAVVWENRDKDIP